MQQNLMSLQGLQRQKMLKLEIEYRIELSTYLLKYIFSNHDGN